MIESTATSPDELFGLPEVPRVVFDRYRLPVKTDGDRWEINSVGSSEVFHWHDMRDIAEPVLIAFKLYMCRSIETHSPAESGNQFRELRSLLRLVDANITRLEDITESVFERLRQRLRDSAAEYRLHRFRAWFLWMADMDFAGVDQEVAAEVSRWRIPGNRKGEAVMSLDPDCGPLSDEEYFPLLRCVRLNQRPTLALAAVMLGLELGANPKNLVLLEERDLHSFAVPGTRQTKFQLDVPRIKKRLDSREVKRRAISEELGRVLTKLISKNRARFGSIDPNRPVLVRTTEMQHLRGTPIERFAFHHRASEVCDLVKEFAVSHNLISPRTGRLLYITPRRLRYTFGTRLAMQGAPANQIAELLDHSDLQHVMIYINSRSTVVERLDKAIGDKVTPFYDRFMGRIVESEAAADPSLDASARIMGTTRVLAPLGGIGTCGAKKLCSLLPPYSCYLCSRFQPWRDAPHDKMLEDLLAYKEQLQAAAVNESDRIPHQLEDIIGAVRQVVDRIAESRGTADL